MTKEPESTDLIPLEKQFPVAKVDAMEVANLIETNLGGEKLTRFDLEQIRVGTSGNPGYVVQLGDEKDVLKEFSAIIVHMHSCRSFYKTSMDEGGGGLPPDCSSQDGLTGKGDNGTGEGVHPCDTCDQSQWGSDKNGRGQACKLQKAIYLYRQDRHSLFPSMLLVPPTSLKSLRDYGMNLTVNLHSMQSCIHKFTTTCGANKDGVDVTHVKVAMERVMTEDEQNQIMLLAEQMSGTIEANKDSLTPNE